MPLHVTVGRYLASAMRIFGGPNGLRLQSIRHGIYKMKCKPSNATERAPLCNP